MPKPYNSLNIKFLKVAKQILKRKPRKQYIGIKHATINSTLPLGVHQLPNKLTLQTQDAKQLLQIDWDQRDTEWLHTTEDTKHSKQVEHNSGISTELCTWQQQDDHEQVE